MSGGGLGTYGLAANLDPRKNSKTIRRERSCSDMDRKPVTVRSYANIGHYQILGKEKKEMVPWWPAVLDFRKHAGHRDDFVASLIIDDRYLLYQWSVSEWGCEHAKMSKIINRYRPEGEGFVRIDTK